MAATTDLDILEKELSACLQAERRTEATELALHLKREYSRNLGHNHPFYLKVLSKLVSIYMEENRWLEAFTLMKSAMEDIDRGGREITSPELLDSMDTFIAICIHEGMWGFAVDECRQALHLRDETLGKEHLQTLMNMARLASIYVAREDWENAKSLKCEEYEIRSRLFAPDDLSVLHCAIDLASIYIGLGCFEDANKKFQETLQTLTTMFGLDHADTLRCMSQLAKMHSKQEQWGDAEQLQVLVLEARERILGEESPVTLNAMRQLVETYICQQKWSDASHLGQCAVDRNLELLGGEHPNTLHALTRLSFIYERQGLSELAIPQLGEVIEAHRKLVNATNMRQTSYIEAFLNLVPESDKTSYLELECEQLERIKGMGEEAGTLLGLDILLMENQSYLFETRGHWDQAEDALIDARETYKMFVSGEDALINLRETCKMLLSGEDGLIDARETCKKLLGDEDEFTRYLAVTLDEFYSRKAESVATQEMVDGDNGIENDDYADTDAETVDETEEVVQALESYNLLGRGIWLGQKDFIEELITQGENVNQPVSPEGDTPMILACLTEQDTLVKLLLESGASADAIEGTSHIPLVLGVQNQNEQIVKMLLESDADPNVVDDEGYTPLLHAVYREDIAIMKLLLDHGADLEKVLPDGVGPLMVAAEFANPASMEALLEYRPNTDITNGCGWTPLHSAVMDRHSAIVKVLLEEGANPNLQTHYGDSALILAARLGYEEIVDILLQHNANTRQVSSNGATPLHYAVYIRHVPIIELLLSYGANPQLLDDLGRTCLDCAAHDSSLLNILEPYSKSFEAFDYAQKRNTLYHAIARFIQQLSETGRGSSSNADSAQYLYNDLGRALLVMKEAGEAVTAFEQALQPMKMTESVMHNGITCDGCKANDFPGVRYVCNTCPDRDLCSICFDKYIDKHMNSVAIASRISICQNHSFLKIPSDNWAGFSDGYINTHGENCDQCLGRLTIWIGLLQEK
ncbi:hypothetical protein GGI43DRAFT_419458 [Trichoderma evansii]